MHATLPVVLGAGAGFLLAVLWFDLMFDVQVRRLDAPDGDARLASIADYYRRVTIEAVPANRLVATVMVVTIAGSGVQLWREPSLRTLVALVLVIATVTLAWRRVVPSAMRLGARADDLPVQRALARTIWRDHVVCFAAILAFLALQL
jgi:hypothetical protein